MIGPSWYPEIDLIMNMYGTGDNGLSHVKSAGYHHAVRVGRFEEAARFELMYADIWVLKLNAQPRYHIQCRKWTEINTDPRNRCYDGCHASSELRWGPWETCATLSESRAKALRESVFTDDRSRQYRLLPADS